MLIIATTVPNERENMATVIRRYKKPIRSLRKDRERSGGSVAGELVDVGLSYGPYAELRGVVCRNEEGKLVLRGVVRSYFLKQLAQEFCRVLAGNRLILNLIEVTQPGG